MGRALVAGLHDQIASAPAASRLREKPHQPVCRAQGGTMPEWLWAGFWGTVAGSALLAGAATGVLANLGKRTVAAVMAFGSGVLISALSFDLMAAAYRRGGFDSTSAGFLGGAVIYSIANWFLARRGARQRKRSGGQQPSEQQQPGSGMAIAVGALLDGIPESMVIGLSLIGGGAVSLVAVIAIFISNIPEGLSSSAGMKKAGRSRRYIFGLWTVVTLVSGLASLIGYAAFRGLSGDVIAAITALAAGAMLAMLADTMIPEAFDDARDWAGLVTVTGFLAAFVLTKLGA
jgi:zinc transporter, ZIP family